ncbi:MAG: hypothetical protein FWB91_02605 [Defluviitaleaceae bacterium]|nr:hypothetical protein [Defluviitaleaceae bacterium]
MQNIRTLYTDNAHFKNALTAMIEKDSKTPIEIPPEQHRGLTEAKDPILCDCVKPGQFTYAQAVTVAEQHLVECVCLSRHKVECSHSRGLSYAICYALALWNGADKATALVHADKHKCPELPDVEICKLSAKKKGMISSPDDIVRMAGPKAAKILFNILRAGPRVILRSAFELLRANFITRILSAVVLLAIDTVNLTRKRISKKQFAINTGLALSMTVGGTAGWLLGQQTAGLVLIENALIAIIAGIAGAGVLGAGLGMLWEKLAARFVKDDTQDMMEILNQEFCNLSQEYLLTTKEVEDLTEAITIKPKNLKTIFAQCDRAHYARCTIEPYVAGIVHLRPKVLVE